MQIYSIFKIFHGNVYIIKMKYIITTLDKVNKIQKTLTPINLVIPPFNTKQCIFLTKLVCYVYNSLSFYYSK